MKIYVGSDHNGHHLKQEVIDYLQDKGHQVEDEGNAKFNPDDDFPIFAARVVNAMKADEDFDPAESSKLRGVLICGSGQGMVIAANRFREIRAGLIYSVGSAKSTRHDEDSNIACLPSDIFRDEHQEDWRELLDIWLKEPFGAAKRFIRRNQELDQL